MAGKQITLFCAEDQPRPRSGELLAQAVGLWSRENGVPRDKLSMARTDRGKPFFPDAPQVHISVTHSGRFWLCALAEQPRGVDLQQIRPVEAEKLARRFFHPQEADYVAAHPESFFRVWCAKESYVKLTGAGISDRFGEFSVVRDGAIRGETEKTEFSFLPFAEGYVLCFCTEVPFELRRWMLT